MSSVQKRQVAELEVELRAVVKADALPDKELEQRVEAVVIRTQRLQVSPGGLMDRLGLFQRRRNGGGAVLLDENSGHPVMKRLAKLTVMMLARNEIWLAEQDIEAFYPATLPLTARCDGQSYRMIRWTSALLSAGFERYCESTCSLWSSLLTTLHLRSRRAIDPAVQEACRGLLRMLWLEPLYHSLARSVPLETLTDWVADSSGREQAAGVARSLQQWVQELEGVSSKECVEALIGGPKAVLQWAAAQLTAPPLPDACEQIMGRCVIDLLDRCTTGNAAFRLPRALRLEGGWVGRLMRVGLPDQKVALRAIVGAHAPQWWAECLSQEDLQDPTELCPILREIFPKIASKLEDRFESTVRDWIHGALALAPDASLPAQLELLAWLGVRQEHADSLGCGALEVSRVLFLNETDSEASCQDVPPLTLTAKWERWAPVARLLPETMVIEGLSSSGGLQAHLKAIVESGHPRLAKRLLQRDGGLEETLHAGSIEMINHLCAGGRCAEWRWWAFLMAHGPRRLLLDSRQGSVSSQLSFALSQVLRMVLVQGLAFREADVILAGLMLRGADPHRSGGNAWGSSAEQLYVVGISVGEQQKRQALQQLLQHLDGLLGRRQQAMASPSSGD